MKKLVAMVLATAATAVVPCHRTGGAGRHMCWRKRAPCRGGWLHRRRRAWRRHAIASAATLRSRRDTVLHGEGVPYYTPPGDPC